MTIPNLICFRDYNGDWNAYLDALYEVYETQLARAPLRFRGVRVSCQRLPETHGKAYRFWHLISNGPIEEDREPDLRRCERLTWIAWVIENADTCGDIDIWENTRGSERNILLWHQEYFLVILSVRNGYFLLKTAYCIEYENDRRKKRRERDAFLNQ
jgi:hypothetical protein